MVTVKRPWYTFDVIEHAYLAFQSVEPAPVITSEKDLEAVPMIQKIHDAGSEAPLKNQLILADYAGTCSMVYDKICYNIGEVIQAQLTVQLDVSSQTPAAGDTGHQPGFPEVKVVFYKIEAGDEDENEVVIKEGVFGEILERIREATYISPEQAASSDPPAEKEAGPADSGALLTPVTNPEGSRQVALPPPVQSVILNENFDFTLSEFPEQEETSEPEGDHAQPPEGDASEQVIDKQPTPEAVKDKEPAGQGQVPDPEDPLPLYPLTPTFIENFGGNLLSVRYFLRLILNDGTKEYWNTNEILLFRSHIQGKRITKVENV